jgi:transposase InsO family protein
LNHLYDRFEIKTKPIITSNSPIGNYDQYDHTQNISLLSMQQHFQADQLAQFAQDYQAGTSLSDIIPQITDELGNQLMPSRSTVLRYWKDHGLSRLEKGRPKKEIDPDVIQFVQTTHLAHPTGMTQMYDAAVRESIQGTLTSDFSYRSIQSAFQILEIPVVHRPVKHAPYRCRYEAEQADLIWHTDLHDHGVDGERRKLIAFIDDASRLIHGFRFLPDKTSKSTSQALQEVFQQCGTLPYCIWTDNGGEFMGEFAHALQAFGIVHKTTKPYNPEQNGKIEKWWQFADKYPADKLADAVQWYNQNQPHRSLRPGPKVGSKSVRQTPLEAYQSLPKSGPGQGGSWIVDGESKPFA